MNMGTVFDNMLCFENFSFIHRFMRLLITTETKQNKRVSTLINKFLNFATTAYVAVIDIMTHIKLFLGIQSKKAACQINVCIKQHEFIL